MMQNDDKVRGGETGNDITADELLLLLNESIREKPAKREKQKKDYAIKQKTESLEIDDSVYESAEKELRRSSRMKVGDDTELDVDELIEKFIIQPKLQREQEAAQNAVAVDEPTAEETVEEADDGLGEIASEPEVTEDVPAVPVMPEIVEAPAKPETAEADSDDSAYAETLALMSGTAMAEPEVADEQSEPEVAVAESIDAPETAEEIQLSEDLQVPEEADDGDVKVLNDISELLATASGLSERDNMSDGDVNAMSGRTAVFDIALVKELTQQGGMVEETEVAGSRTEVFTPIHEDELALIPAETAESSEAPVDTADEEPAVEETVAEEAEEVASAAADEAIDRTDMDLMIALGMEEELVDAVGEQQASAIGDDIVQKHEETAQMQAAAAMGEFTSFEQVKGILTDYMHKYYLLIARIAAAVLVLGALFVFENYAMLGITLPDFMRPTSYPVVYAMVDLQLVFFACALTGKCLLDGVRGIVRFKPVAECLMPFVMILSIVYTATVCHVAPMGEFKLFNMPVALAALLALVFEFLNLKRDIFSFNVIATTKKKFVISPVSAETEVLERAAFEEFVPAESEIVRVVKTDFVDGFFNRISGMKVVKPSVGLAIPIVVILAAAFTVLSFMKSDSLYESATMAFMAAMFIVPTVSFVIYSYPFYKASRDSYENNSAVIGETSLTEYSSSAVISFEDKEVFPSSGVKVTSIKVYGNNRIDEIIYKLSSAFIKVGGPLADVLKQATHELGHSDNVELLSVEDDGFAVSVDDIQTYIGKSAYMERHDYDPPYDHEGRLQEQEGSVGVMYVAYGGQLAAKVYVRYNIDYEFEKILSQLNRTGLCVGIKSFDPNIDDVLLSKKIKTAKYPVKVVRSKNVEDIPHSVEKCSSGIVSTGSVKALLRTVAACERTSGVIKTGLIVKVLSMLIGVVVMSLIYAFGDIMTVSSLYITLYQLFWAIPVLLISKFLV